MKIIALIRSELKRLTATSLARLALVALMVVPLLYGGMYLWANQNPYAKLDHIPAAIVNNDSGAKDSDGNAVNYGDKVTDQLVKGGDFDWHVVSAKQASKGIRDETYNFVFTIPSDFSDDLTSTGSQNPTAAKINLTTNDTTSYLSSTIADQAGNTIRATVTQEVSKQAASTLLVGLNDVRTNLGTAASGSQKLVDGSKQLKSGLDTAKSGADSLASGNAQLASGATSLNSGLQTLQSKTAQLPAQTKQLSDGLDQLKSQTASLPASSKQLADGLDQLRSSTKELPAKTKQLSDGLGNLKSQTTNLPGQTKALATGLDTLSATTAKLPKQTAALSDGSSAVASGANSLSDALGSASAQGKQQAALLPGEVTTNLRNAGFSDEDIAKILNASAPLTDALATANSTFDTLHQKAAPLVAGSNQVASGAKTLNESAADLAAVISQAAAGADQLATKTPALTAGIASASDGATLLASQTPALTAGIGQAAGGADQLAAKTPALTNGIAQLDAGANQLSAAAPALTNGIAQAANGSSQLSTGATQASTGATNLASGITKLDSGAADLVSGATKLTSGLNDGIDKIPATTSATRDKQAAAIANPVTIKDSSIASAGSYGAGLAPFFISLAAWIGMYALFLIIKPISKRAITAVKAPARITLAGWLTPAALGLLQMLALFAIVKFALGFDVSNPAGMIGIMVLASAAFAAIIMTLNVWLGSVGQFLGLVLMLVQLVTAGGTFPWQTLPGPLAALHFALPMSYAVDAIRQLMYGGSMSAAWNDAGVLALWLLGALLLSFLAASRMTRKRTMRDLRPSLIG